MNRTLKKFMPAVFCVSMTLFSQVVMADESEHSGQATFYGYGGGGNCSFPKDDSLLTVAMNATDYAGSAACGGLIKVTSQNTGASIIVRG
ncbi:hypothetical protein P4S72_17440 [Vibrio sp. PP-XX7]